MAVANEIRTFTLQCDRCRTRTSRDLTAAWSVGPDRTEWVGLCECGAHLVKHTPEALDVPEVETLANEPANQEESEMTEQTTTLKLTAAQLAALEYVIDDWAGAVSAEEADVEAGQGTWAAAMQVYRMVEPLVRDEQPQAQDDAEDAYVQNVQVEVMYEANDEGADLTPEEAARVMHAAGVPVKSKLATKTEFDGSYLVDVDAVWYTQLGDSGEYYSFAEGYAVSLARP